MNRRDFTANTALQTTFIMRIQRELRCPAMEESVQVTISAPYSGLLIPNDFLELIDIYPLNTYLKLTKTDITKALVKAQVNGNPDVYCRQGAKWVLGPAPNIGDVIQIDYYAGLPALVNPTDTNVISLMAWDIIVYAALVQAAIYYKDMRKDDWEEQYQTILNDLQDQSDEDDENGAAVVQPCHVMPPDWEFEHY